MNKDPNVLAQSLNPRELVDMARVYALSEDVPDQQLLLQHLGSPSFLGRLNTEQEYLSLPPKGLNVARVMKTLMTQTHPAAADTLVALTRMQSFQQVPSLVELNILGLAIDRPASPGTIAYWDFHSSPESSNIDIVMEAIFANRSEPALRLFESKMNDEDNDGMRKMTWLRDQFLRQRNDVTVLRFSERMLKENTLNESWHNQLLEVLFDYNEKWYMSCAFPRPPERMAASDEAKEVMVRLGEFGLRQMQIAIPGLTARIKGTMKILGNEIEE